MTRGSPLVSAPSSPASATSSDRQVRIATGVPLGRTVRPSPSPPTSLSRSVAGVSPQRRRLPTKRPRPTSRVEVGRARQRQLPKRRLRPPHGAGADHRPSPSPWQLRQQRRPPSPHGAGAAHLPQRPLLRKTPRRRHLPRHVVGALRELRLKARSRTSFLSDLPAPRHGGAVKVGYRVPDARYPALTA